MTATSPSLLAEHEQIHISCQALRRLLRDAGLASPRRRRRHRARGDESGGGMVVGDGQPQATAAGDEEIHDRPRQEAPIAVA